MDSESFRNNLEGKARRIAEKTRQSGWEDSLEGILGREITLVVENLDQVREMTKEEHRQLFKLECKIGSDICGLIPLGRLRYYNDPHIDRRLRLKRRVVDLERERIRLQTERETKLSELHTQLLELVEKHERLNIIENGD